MNQELGKEPIEQEIKKQTLIEFGHKCGNCKKICTFESAKIFPIIRNKKIKPTNFICLCPECAAQVNQENPNLNTSIRNTNPPEIQTSNNEVLKDLLPHTTLIITLSSEIKSLSQNDQKFLQSALSVYLNLSRNQVQIKAVEGFPVEVSVELPTKKSEVLLESFVHEKSEIDKFLSPIKLARIERKRIVMRWLTDEELKGFRDDYRDLEKEIQNFFRAYYLSGLILVAAWLIGQSKPLLELSIGNGGYNIYALLGLALLNMAAMTYLIHKSIAIHEVTQFITYLSKPDSVFNYWEGWRRSPQNYSNKAYPFYYVMITVLPFFVSFLILYHCFYVLNTPSEILLSEIRNQQIPQMSLLNNSSTIVDYEGLTKIELQKKAALEQKLNSERVLYGERTQRVFATAWWAFIAVGITHIIPILLVVINSYKQNQKWEDLNDLRNWRLLFQDLRINPSATNEAASPSDEFILYSKDYDNFLSEFTDEELKAVIKRIKSEANKKTDG